MADFMQDILPLLSPAMGILGGPGGSIHLERLFNPALIASAMGSGHQGQQGQMGSPYGLGSVLMQQGGGGSQGGGMFGLGRLLSGR